LFPARPYVVAFARWSQCKKLTIAQPNQPLILNVSLGSGNNIVHRRSQGDKPSVGKLSPELSAFRATRAKWRRLRGSSFLDAGQSLRIHLIFGRSAHRRPQPKFLMLARTGAPGGWGSSVRVAFFSPVPLRSHIHPGSLGSASSQASLSRSWLSSNSTAPAITPASAGPPVRTQAGGHDVDRHEK